MKKEYTCTTCSKKFKRYVSTVRNKDAVFCCVKCYRLYQRIILKRSGNPNYKNGKYLTGRFCKCGAKISPRAEKCFKCRNNYIRSEKEILIAINNCRSLRETGDYLKVSHQWLKRRVKELKPDMSHFKRGQANRLIAEEVFLINKKISIHTVKKFFLLENENICYDCGLKDVWNGKLITLQLHHKNLKHYDHRRKNLVLLCPNCHTQKHKRR